MAGLGFSLAVPGHEGQVQQAVCNEARFALFRRARGAGPSWLSCLICIPCHVCLRSSQVVLKTTHGDIDVELWAKEAPKVCYMDPHHTLQNASLPGCCRLHAHVPMPYVTVLKQVKQTGSLLQLTHSRRFTGSTVLQQCGLQ